MKLRDQKYKKIVLSSYIFCSLILLFEVLPGYWNLLSNLFTVTIEQLSGTNTDELHKQLSISKESNSKIKEQYFGISSFNENNNNYSNILEMFSVNNKEFDLSISSIKPLKKIKSGRLDFQRINLEVNSNYESFYNYCRWLEITAPTVDFVELNAVKQKDDNKLDVTMLIDLLYLEKKE